MVVSSLSITCDSIVQVQTAMDDQLGGNVQSNPHWTGDTSKVRRSADGSISIPARALNITWGNDPRYWEWTKFDGTESRVAGFEEGVTLQQVNWLEVRGRLEVREMKRRAYKVFYVMKFNEDAFGWSQAVMKFKVRLEDEGNAVGPGHDQLAVALNLKQYREKPGTWHRVYVGEFNVVGNDMMSAVNVEVGMLEVESDWWKGGMVLAGIRIEPN